MAHNLDELEVGYAEQLKDSKEFWEEVQETSFTIAHNFVEWVVALLSGPLKEIARDLNDILFPPPFHETPTYMDYDTELSRSRKSLFNQEDYNQKNYTAEDDNAEWKFKKPMPIESNVQFPCAVRQNSRNFKAWEKETNWNAIPQHDILDIGLDTQCYAYKSHALLTIHTVENVSKIIESSITYGDFHLKGPGFCLENIRIPIRKGGDQIISVRFVAHDYKNNFENSTRDAAGLIEYRVDLPLSLVRERVHKKWMILSVGGELYRACQQRGIMPEASYLMQSDDKNIRVKEPRMNFSLWKCMQGVMEMKRASPRGSSHNIQRIYVGYFDDPIDIAVAKLVNEQPRILTKKLIEKDRRSGQYSIDGTRCDLTLNDEGNVIVFEGGARQPLMDYLNESTANISWDPVQPICAIDQVNPNLLPILKSSPSQWEDNLDRAKSMELACHRAAIREQIAIELLKSSDRIPPTAIYDQHLSPVNLSVSPHSPPTFVTYTWGPGYANPQLVQIDEYGRTACEPFQLNSAYSSINSQYYPYAQSQQMPLDNRDTGREIRDAAYETQPSPYDNSMQYMLSCESGAVGASVPNAMYDRRNAAYDQSNAMYDRPNAAYDQSNAMYDQPVWYESYHDFAAKYNEDFRRKTSEGDVVHNECYPTPLQN
ncbi:hypothetical protein IE077_000124 [Cardiosporidium cionae]|uniref:Uncharacterized protein n=1 Tax=Cardiosporidium cionae TaxID=476202 RepID=A0ABQ7J5P4_9APIC|nr:hypothetical protein IE077_000124 [Cardiosporidium cionae]|eukprot:KAF8819273.1 hypothetical protein IE077_000124 [Cardiosporidium cionae]